MRTAIFVAIAAATISAPALAQSDGGEFTGPRLGVTSGYDKMQDKDGATYGVAAGYDVAVTPKVRAGVEVGLADSTTDFGTTDASRDVSASARLGYVVNPRLMAFGKVGYASSRFEDSATRAGAAQEGVRYGGGVEVSPSQRTYVSAEYQRTEYGAGLGGRDAAMVGVGLRF
ncbi:MAG TPA: outer membrane beta-barrel protein [Sphingobium sp.]|nr:outer membrane beta-barrel protein [Sphingobium sp.]